MARRQAVVTSLHTAAHSLSPSERMQDRHCRQVQLITRGPTDHRIGNVFHTYLPSSRRASLRIRRMELSLMPILMHGRRARNIDSMTH
ncbi:hypothetical protein OH76DRAFT_461764 [Lentinus brumalis]|uniref:Uncharacterized protein n=1 Tax=Lentinus brumalis TaxID=2498619 RepID=A0A371DCF0_9APHY|nr:hypothetical protein OH76DRAFT_461764 [Polyporus brumalis]